MKYLLFLLSAGMLFAGFGCATGSDREPQGYNRAGREYREPRAMNYRSNDSNSFYQACLRERPAADCRNRLGR